MPPSSFRVRKTMEQKKIELGSAGGIGILMT